jgi:hypothetical protein
MVIATIPITVIGFIYFNKLRKYSLRESLVLAVVAAILTLGCEIFAYLKYKSRN